MSTRVSPAMNLDNSRILKLLRRLKPEVYKMPSILKSIHRFILADDRIMEQFRGRRWMNLLPEHLDYQFTQILFIGEKSSAFVGDVEELEKLEEQDEARVNHLKGENAVFKDLELSKKDFLPGALHGNIE